MTTTTSSIDTQRMGIGEFAEAIAAGALSKEMVFDIINHRIDKRRQAGKPLVLRVVQYRNELAKQLGLQEIPEPQYASKQQPAPLPTVDFSDADAVADHLVSLGVDAGALVTALVKRVSGN